MEGMIRSYYRVAEHLFAVECSNSALLDMMTNYEPFREQPTIGEEIFVLRIEGEKAEAKGKNYTHVLTDNAEEDMPRIEVYKGSLEDANAIGCSQGELQDALTGYGKEGRGDEEMRREGWLFRVAMVANAPICCEMECDEDFTAGVLHINADCQDVRFCIDNALMLLFAFRTAPMMTLEMHAAVVVKKDRLKHLTTPVSSGMPHAVGSQAAALLDRPEGLIDQQELGYLFLGHSGTGKSTHARMWLQAFDDAWLLNDDNPILRVMEDGEVRVYGSPWSGKTPCYNNAYARVGGIVKLSQAPHNKIRTLSLPEAYAYMLSSASGLKMDRHMADCMYESIKHVITHVKCYHLECLPNTEAAEVALGAME